MAVEATKAPPVTATNTGTNSTSNTASSNTTIANNFQTFLTLLTTQLQNQNPLDPLEPVHGAARAIRRGRAAAAPERPARHADQPADAPNDTTAAITITNSAGQTVFSGNYPISKGKANFTWDGKGNDGTQWPAGYYTINASGKDTAGNNVAIPSEVQGVVDSVDLTASPPLLSVGGQTYTTDQIKRVVRPGAA